MSVTRAYPLVFICLVIAGSLTTCRVVDTAPVQMIEPYLAWAGDTDEMSIMWHLLEEAECTIEWGLDTEYTMGRAVTRELDGDHTHRHTIANLTPGETYYYRVTLAGESCEGSFRAPPTDGETELKFMVYGDSRSNPGTHDQVCGAIVDTYTGAPGFRTFVLHAGDIIGDGDSVYSWAADLFSPDLKNIRRMLLDVPLMACMGNHEESGILFRKYLPYDFSRGRYYDFTWGPAHVIVVDQYTSLVKGSAQYEWVVDKLQASDRTWRFLLLHEPGWAAGGHDNNRQVQEVLHPLCVEYGVAMVFNGHAHSYSRAVVDGVQYVTTGGGGAPLHSVDPTKEHIVSAAARHHFCTVEITGNSLAFEAVQPDGMVLDAVTVSR
jgi:hypothetical protein